jgi:hypothetical protein
MKATVQIEQINYFGESTGTTDFNAKVLYRKNGKLYLTHVYVDFWNRRVHEGNNNPKECKTLSGFMSAINEYAEKRNFYL